MINYALIMAAGRGLRLMPMTLNLPKPMVEMTGETIISKSLKQLKEQVPKIAITVGYHGALLAKHVIEENVSAVFNTNGHGNCWWLFNTLMKYLNEPVLVLTCDNIVKIDISFIIDEYIRLGSPDCMFVPVGPVEGIEGDYIFGENNLVNSLSRERPTPFFCSGIQLLNPVAINRSIPECDDFNDLWNLLIESKKLYFSSIYPHPWYSINTIEQLLAIETKAYQIE
jgi:MurNAc alpha-1-phosphate uridylyltransferase